MTARRAGKRLEVFGTKKAERYAHGTHARYALGPCCCFPCKLANADYETSRHISQKLVWQCRFAPRTRKFVVTNSETHEVAFRSSDRDEARAEQRRLNKRDTKAPAPRPSELVPIGKVRKHIRELQERGVGLKRIAKEARVAYSSLGRMMYSRGHRPITRTRRSTAERILAVKATAIAGGAHVEAGPTLELLGRLIKAGHKKFWIAKQLGLTSKTGRPALQITGRNGYISFRNARKVFHLYLKLQQLDWRLPKIAPILIVPQAESTQRRRRKEAA